MPKRGESWNEDSKKAILESREATLQAKETRYCPSCEMVRSIHEYRIPRTGRRWAAYCVPCEVNPDSQYRQRQALQNRKTTLKKYGLTLEQYDEMVSEQDGLCYICTARLEVVDHCHNSGNTRKLLCHGCNKGLGAFKDDPALLRRAASYLEEH